MIIVIAVLITATAQKMKNYQDYKNKDTTIPVATTKVEEKITTVVMIIATETMKTTNKLFVPEILSSHQLVDVKTRNVTITTLIMRITAMTWMH